MQTLDKAHSLGIHHLVTAREDKARRAASAGFEGKVKIWTQNEDGVWTEYGEIVGGYALCFLLEIQRQTFFIGNSGILTKARSE